MLKLLISYLLIPNEFSSLLIFPELSSFTCLFKQEIYFRKGLWLRFTGLWIFLLFWLFIYYFSSVQLLSRVQLFANPWTATWQASLFITYSPNLLKPMSIKSMMPSNHLILCRPLLFLPSISPSIRVFSSESFLHIRWPKYWSFSFSVSPSNEYSGLISFKIDYFDLLACPRDS